MLTSLTVALNRSALRAFSACPLPRYVVQILCQVYKVLKNSPSLMRLHVRQDGVFFCVCFSSGKGAFSSLSSARTLVPFWCSRGCPKAAVDVPDVTKARPDTTRRSSASFVGNLSLSSVGVSPPKRLVEEVFLRAMLAYPHMDGPPISSCLFFFLITDPGGGRGALYRLRGHPWAVLRRPQHLQAQRLALGEEPVPFQRGLRGQVRVGSSCGRCCCCCRCCCFSYFLLLFCHVGYLHVAGNIPGMSVVSTACMG